MRERRIACEQLVRTRTPQPSSHNVPRGSLYPALTCKNGTPHDSQSSSCFYVLVIPEVDLINFGASQFGETGYCKGACSPINPSLTPLPQTRLPSPGFPSPVFPNPEWQCR